MTTIDLKKTERRRYDAAPEPRLIDIPPMRYLMVDGAGDPNSSPAYSEAIETLFPVAYAVRNIVKRLTGIAYVVAPLEGLWWAADMEAFSVDDKDSWLWTMMIRLPDAAGHDLVGIAIDETNDRKHPPAGHLIRDEILDEGSTAQILHRGSFAEEGPTIDRLHAFIAEQGLERTGKHHEIYLSDPRRSRPERMRTVIRQPVRTPANN